MPREGIGLQADYDMDGDCRDCAREKEEKQPNYILMRVASRSEVGPADG